MLRVLVVAVLIFGLIYQVTCQNQCCKNCLAESNSRTVGFCNQRIGFEYFRCPTNLQTIGCTGPFLYNPRDSSLFGGVKLCDNCPAGWYRPFDTTTCPCRQCFTASCPANQYITAECTIDYNVVCQTCGTCGVGQETQTACGARSNTVCRDCLAGTFRDQNVVNEQQTCRACTVCQTSQRQRRTGCSATSNEQCPQCSEGHIVVVNPSPPDGCRECGAGTFARASDNTCATCRNCANTERQTRACTPDGDRQCTACTNNERVRSLNSQTCDGCVDGYYRTNVPSCAICDGSSCGEGRYRTCYNTADEGGKRDCNDCQGQQESTGSNICAAGRGVSERCEGTGVRNVQCADCPAGTERPAGTPLADKIQKCIVCGMGKFKASAGIQNCGDCTNKPALNTQYVSWGFTTPSSNACPW